MTDRRGNRQGWAIIWVGLVIAGLTAVTLGSLLWGTICGAWVATQTLGWREQECALVHVEPEAVEYLYIIDGEQRTGHLFDAFSATGAVTPDVPRSWAVGDVMPCYVNPADSSQVFLVRGWTRDLVIAFCFYLILPAVAIPAIVISLRRSQRPPPDPQPAAPDHSPSLQ